MGIQHLLYIVMVIGAFVAYWWFTTGRHGANAVKVQAGLRADEEMVWLSRGYFKLDLEKKDIAMAMVGVGRTGKSFTIARTQGGELVLKPQGDDPFRYQPDQIQLVQLKTDVDKMPGVSGVAEPADLFEAQVRGAQSYKLVLARSIAADINQGTPATA